MIFIQVLIWIVAGAIATVGIYRSLTMEDKNGNTTIHYRGIVEAGAAIAAALLFSASFGEVPAGYRGVVLRFGGTTGEVKQPGLYVVAPFVTRVVNMNVQVQAYSADAASASNDLQNVQTRVTLNYSVDPDKVVDVYNRLNQDYADRIVNPAIQEATKAATAHFSAEELITRRPEARDLLQKDLENRMNAFDMHIAAMSITDFQFSKEFSDAIEQKVVAFQNYLKAENQLKQARIDAESAIASARGDAEANRLRRLQISQLTVYYDAVQKWDGHMPAVTSGNGVLLNLGALQPSEKP